MVNDSARLKQAKAEIAKRTLARKDLKAFLLLKWERYNRAHFLDNWHFDYICKVLEHTLPQKQDEGGTEVIPQKHTKAAQILRLMINMPPSYGKTEVFARTFIAWALGRDRKRKFIYISYSDELCRKICNQVRDLIKSKFWGQVFGEPPLFLFDNSTEFQFKEGGGLFVTTLKSSITGFHAHQILVDDPIKVVNMRSKTERDLVNQNFKESVLSRLQDRQANITILMQKLGDEDLCGFLLNERYFEKDVINEWQVIKLQAINDKPERYEIGDYTYERKKREALFPARHTLEELEHLRLQMGSDEFSTQYQQEPQVSEAGYFEAVYFKELPSYEIGEVNMYIFVDNATSLNASADNRAIVAIGAEAHKSAVRYVVFDVDYGIWSEEETIAHLIAAMQNYKSAKVFIESEAGGVTLKRLLDVELVRVNTELKMRHKELISNAITCYTPSRKVSKVEKIKALRPFYNTGFLAFLHTARGLDQVKRELLGFNPQKPFRKDDCIDCIASAIAHSEVVPPPSVPPKVSKPSRARFYPQSVGWNI